MSFELCVQDAIDEGSVDRERGQRAQALWKERSALYESQGHPRHTAEAFAAEDVKASLKKDAGATRHSHLAQLATMRKQQLRNKQAWETGTQRSFQRTSVEFMEMQARGLVRQFNGVMGDFIRKHHRNIVGNVTDPAAMRDMVKELYGRASGNANAKALAEGVSAGLERLRLMANERGANIGKLDIYGLPQSHNSVMLTRAGFDQWFGDVRESINWSRVEDPLTGRPMQGENSPAPPIEAQRSFLQETYNNIVFGKGSDAPTYGQPQGQALYRSLSQKRVLHFLDDEAWIKYNAKYGSGDPYKSLMNHVHNMSRDIAAMQEFGPNPQLGLDFQRQVAVAEARKRGAVADMAWVEGDGKLARNMLRVWAGPQTPTGPFASRIATGMATTRHMLTAAFLDKAIIPSISDAVSIRLASQIIGMNPNNVLSAHVRLMKDTFAGKGEFLDDAMRQKFILDTMADPGSTMARYNSEIPPLEVAEKISSGVMRLQGLSGWTDAGRVSFQWSLGGHFAKYAGKPMREVDPGLLREMERFGITESEWKKFADPERLYKSDEGATFLNPMWWRSTFDSPTREIDDLAMKMQGFVEAWTERAVPSQSLLVRGVVDPVAWGLPPGSVPYEVIKSGIMFKSFVGAFSVNQVRNVMALPTAQARAEHVFKLVAGMTILGGLALQIGEIVAGRDPQDMTDPAFMGRALMKGGGLGPVGDIIAAGESTFGGLGAYLAGPVPVLATDAYKLTFQNLGQLAMGEDTNFATELGRNVKRYTPGGQLPFLGPAYDRLFADQLTLALDPEAADAMVRASRRNQTTFGRGEDYWMPGRALPDRAPNWSAAIGQ